MMIDLHCHLHYGVDDGPKTALEAKELARALVDEGVEIVACTSHLRPDKDWINDRFVQAQNHARLDSLLDEAGIEIGRVAAAEHYVDHSFMKRVEEHSIVPYGDSRWVLVELNYDAPVPALLDRLFRMRQLGYKVLLAHLERYPWVVDSDEMLEKLNAAGHLIQVNLGSLAGAYGRDFKKRARKLVEGEWASVASSDCHHLDDVKPYLIKGRKALRKLVGDTGCRKMMFENPKAILDDAGADTILYS
jgi:protein-tyrosine phosphatase